MPDKKRTSMRVTEKTLDELDTYADDEGLNRSQAIEHVVEEWKELRQTRDRTFVERVASSTERVLILLMFSLLWVGTVVATFAAAGPTAAIEALGAAGYVGLLALALLTLTVAGALLWVVTLAGLAIATRIDDKPAPWDAPEPEP